MDHPLLADLRRRYATKRYDPNRRIPAETLAILYEALRLTPSSINSQPWRFLVIESQGARERLYGTFEEKFQFNRPHVFDASQVILMAHNPRYTRADYGRVIDADIAAGRTRAEDREAAFGAFAFVDLNTLPDGSNAAWTNAQTYIGVGNLLLNAARLGLDATPMEGVDAERIQAAFADELDGYVVQVAVALGYHDPEADYNAAKPKGRLPLDHVLRVL